MARRFQKKNTTPPKHLRIDVTRIKQQCICSLNGLCQCPTNSNGHIEIKNGEIANQEKPDATSPLR